MKKLRGLATMTLILGSVLVAQTNLWEQTNGPYGGDIRAMAVVGSNLLAGTSDDGMFLSSDNGTTWTKVTSWSINNVSSFVIKGSKIFAAGGGVYVSTDNGVTWEATNLTFPASVHRLAVNGTNLIAAGDSVFISTDDGMNWNAAANGLPSSSVLSLAADGTQIFAGTSGNGVFRSTDNGSTWTTLNSGLVGLYYVYSLAINGTTLFAGGGGGVFRSTNNGANWTAANSGLPTQSIRSFALVGTRLFAGTDEGIFVSTDDGISWTGSNSGLPTTSIWSLAAEGTNLYAGTYGAGVFLSTNNGAQWTGISSGLPRAWIWSLARNESDVFAAGEGGIYRSTDFGACWISRSSGLGTVYARVVAVNDIKLLAGGIGNGVSLSTDSGMSWSTINNGLPLTEYGGYESVNDLAIKDGYFFVALGDTVYRSTDGGESWWPALGERVFSIAVYQSNVFAVTGDSVFRSADNGINWTVVLVAPVSDFAVGGSSLFAGGDTVYRSTNSGASWIPLATGSLNAPLNCLTARGEHLFAGTGGGWDYATDVLFSANGSTWISIGVPRGELSGITSLAIIDSNLFAATDQGVSRRSLSDIITSVRDISSKAPGRFSLEQNYPNPFNPSTEIEFQIPEVSRVTLKIYDLLGREVATLVNEELSPGRYEVTWDGTGFPSGIYFFRLQTGEFAETKKLVLMK